MPKDADHMHYYINSKGKYKRKLVHAADFALMLLAGGAMAKNQQFNYDGIVTSARWYAFRRRAPKYTKKTTHAVYFPYQIQDKYKQPADIKFRAFKHNRCPQCPTLEEYWNE